MNLSLCSLKHGENPPCLLLIPAKVIAGLLHEFNVVLLILLEGPLERYFGLS